MRNHELDPDSEIVASYKDHRTTGIVLKHLRDQLISILLVNYRGVQVSLKLNHCDVEVVIKTQLLRISCVS